MNIFNDFLALLGKIAIICLLIGLCLGFWLAQKAIAETTMAGAVNTLQLVMKSW
jgi:ABC-type proline/glycine betaine transport system permease subunit